MEHIKHNLQAIWDRIENAAVKSGRKKENVTLVAVTKTVPVEHVRRVIELGVTNIGESRIQEANAKKSEIGNGKSEILLTEPSTLSPLPSLKWNLIGHLQTNKVKQAVQIFDLIQSLDSVHLAEEIEKQAAKINKVQDCLIEIKVSDEATKFGLPPEQLPDFINQVAQFKHIRLCGMMSMAPYFDNPDDARPYFRKAKTIFDEILKNYGLWTMNCGLLSMGMTNDFEVAIEEGSNMVRVGTGIFKPEKTC